MATSQKGFARELAPPPDIQRAGDPSLGGGRGFRYEWEEQVAAVDARLATLETAVLTPAGLPQLTNTPVEVKAGPGAMCAYMVLNTNTQPAFVQVFDALAADVTVGTTPAAYFLSIPAGSAANMAFPTGVEHAVAITVAATDAADSASAPPIALSVSLFYS
jgi:hypothetical protein